MEWLQCLQSGRDADKSKSGCNVCRAGEGLTGWLQCLQSGRDADKSGCNVCRAGEGLTEWLQCLQSGRGADGVAAMFAERERG